MIKLRDVQVRAQYRIRVRYRLMVLEYASGHGPTAAGRRFGVSARTVRHWRARWRAAGVEGLVPRYPRHRHPRLRAEVIEFIRHARQELAYGASRTRLWLQRVHQVRLAMGTIQRVFRDLGVPRLRAPLEEKGCHKECLNCQPPPYLPTRRSSPSLSAAPARSDCSPSAEMGVLSEVS